MQGKADMLVAKRTLSALIVVCVVMSAFAGLLFLAQPLPTRAQAIGDLTITSGTYTIENIVQPIDGNVNVSGTGQLIVRDGTLSVISNNNPGQMHAINVRSGGHLILEHGTITTYLDQIDPYPYLTITIDTGGHLEATEQSLLMFPGHIYINSGAVVTLTDSTVTKLPSSEIILYVVGSGGSITMDQADDGPAISVSSSTLQLFDSTIDALPEYPTGSPASNLTLSGASNLTAVNSYISVDFGPASVPSDWYTHNVLVLNDASHAYLYGVEFATYSGALADRSAAIVASGTGTSPAVPLTKLAEDNTGDNLVNLAAIDGATYQVMATQTMAVDTWNTGSLSLALPVSSAAIIATYAATSDYGGTNSIQWAREGYSWSSTGIIPTAGTPPGTTAVFDIPLASVPTVSDIRNLNVRFGHSGPVGSGYVEFDGLWVVFTVGADASIYRWLNVTVGDEYGVPIPDALVSARFTGSSQMEGQSAIYYTSSGIATVPPSEVLTYLGVTSATYALTKSDGIATIPYLTDLITYRGGVDSLFLGSYELTGSATIGGTNYSSTESFSFPAYPAMTRSDQNFDVTVELAGVSAPSPDQSRWLVVPPSLTINDMSYYHAGDVIVAADGQLTLENTIFQLVQSSPNQRTVFVDGTTGHAGRLLVNSSTMTSALPINIIVKGVGILEVVDSHLVGINIVAEGNSQVILRNSSMDGTITTSWDSNAVITISDSELSMTPVLSGNSRGGFTNTSVPSITVQDSAYAQIFRWILVWVYDGAGQPLPHAIVEARYYVSPPDVTSSAETDLTGVAKVNCLGTNITSAGSTFVGNYKVNATYTYNSLNYYADEELSVGVMPYTEPLGRNATYATMTIPGAKPDLAIHASPVPVTVIPTNPLRGTYAQVSARVNNDGVSSAFNVQVNFYDNKYGTYTGIGMPSSSELFATEYIPYIAPGTSAVVSAQWYADYPRESAEHHLVVIADPENKTWEINDALSQATYIYSIQVQVLPDLEIRQYEIRSLETPEIDKQVNLSAIVWNTGDEAATNVMVEFYDGTEMIGWDTITSINPNGSAEARIQHTFTVLGQHTIWVSADPDHVITEVSESNNNVSKDLEVYDHPDLQLSSLQFVVSGGTAVTAVNGNTWINITAVLWNGGSAPVANPVVTLWINITGGDSEMKTITVTGTFAGSFFSTQIVSAYKVPRHDHEQQINVTMVVNQARTIRETDYSNNIVTSTLTVRDDRPDLSVISSDISVKRGAVDIQSDTFGSVVSIVTVVKNLGGREASFKMRVNITNGAVNFTISESTYNLSANATDYMKEILVSWTISQWVPGDYVIWIWLDPTNQLSETNEANNMASTPFAITQLQVVLTVTTDTAEYKAGKTMVVTATIQYTTSTFPPVKSLQGVTFFLWDNRNPSNPVKITSSVTTAATTNDNGKIEQPLIIPLDLPSGSYTVGATIAGVDYNSGTPVQISSAVGGGLFPMWVWLVIIIAVVAIVAGFTVYTYVYGLGKLVECGECGAFIPAASKRCPKCGVEFEAGTMKCSECGAWIPADSTECPNCGVKFVGEVEDEADYMERMRKEYDEMVSKYRELAKTELGKKFSDREFDDWWRNQPGYITFDDWLAKEEEKKKEGPVPCPVCGTLNPKEATVCHKCGTVFAGATTQLPGRRGPPPAGPSAVTPVPMQPEAGAQQPPGAAPRMVIRRPIDRKVVPKKIIKTPLGAEEKTEGGDETEENQ